MTFKNFPLFVALLILLNACKNTAFIRKNGGIKYQESEKQADLSPIKIVQIPEVLEEISGLLIDHNVFYGFNDSGGEASVYKINEEGDIIKTIALKGIKNNDFECIAMSDTHIFVGDIGNNLGNRKNLKVYYFPKSVLNNQKIQEVDVKTMSFYYPEQTDFSAQNRNHDFDAEAMYFHNNRLHIFTKEWKSYKTHHYVLEITPEEQAAKLLESYNAGFLVTGADAITKGSQTITAFVGYTLEGDVFYFQNEIDNSTDLIFNKKPTHYFLGSSINLGQVEGVALINNTNFCISAERFGFSDTVVFEHISYYKIN